MYDSEEVITQIKREQKKAFLLKLYDLTKFAKGSKPLRLYGQKKTLDMLQELYEEKLVTYPRNGQPARDGGYEGYCRGNW